MTKHGAPDWAKYRPDSVTFPVQDMAELAARLGSIITFDRRGDLLWVDGFENGLAKWFTLTLGTNSTAALNVALAETGGYSCKLTAGPSTNDYATILKHLRFSGATRLGLETRFNFQSVNNVHLQFTAVISTGTRRLQGTVRINPSTQTLEIQTGATTWTSLGTIALSAAVNLFHALKLVIDPTTEKYTRLLIDANSYDLTTHALYALNSALSPAASITLRLETLAAIDRHLYIDNAIVTQDEP